MTHRPRQRWTPPLERAGRPWWPANAAEADAFAALWCQRCKRHTPARPCPILAAGLDPQAPPPPAWIYNPNGLPWCAEFDRRPLPGETGSAPRPAATRPTTPTLFD